MARKPKKTREPSRRIADLVKRDTGAGLSPSIVDRIDWEDVHPRDAPWYEALQAVDRDGDGKPLSLLFRALARGQEPPAPKVWGFVGDLLERHQFRRQPGGIGRRTPAYDRSFDEWRAHHAVLEVRALRRRKKMSVADAQREVAASLRMPLSTVANAYRGGRGSTNRRRSQSKS